MAEGGAGRGDNEIGALGEFAASPVGDPVDGGKDRLAELAHRVERAVESLALTQPVLLGHGFALPQVATHGEGPVSCTGQHYDPYRGANRDPLDGLGQQGAHLGGDGVVGMGPVEGDQGHPTFGEVVQEHGRLGLLDVGCGRAEVQRFPAVCA